MSDHKVKLLGWLSDSIDSALFDAELRIRCSDTWCELSNEEQGEILLLIDQAKAFSDGLEPHAEGGKFARTMLELGQRLGDLDSRYFQSLSTANSRRALNNSNQNWSLKLKPILGIMFSRKAEAEWKRHPELKLRKMAELLAKDHSPRILELMKELSKEQKYAWMSGPLENRCKKDSLSKEFVRTLLVEQDRKSAFIPAYARMPGPSRSAKS